MPGPSRKAVPSSTKHSSSVWPGTGRMNTEQFKILTMRIWIDKVEDTVYTLDLESEVSAAVLDLWKTEL